MEKKGTVTALSSLYPVEEAQKASMRVQDAIADRQQQLSQVKGFIGDNISLINLVKKLPDETHHNIMVIIPLKFPFVFMLIPCLNVFKNWPID